MDFLFQFASVHILYAGLAILGCAAWYYKYYYKSPFYVYPVTNILSTKHTTQHFYKKVILLLMRGSVLIGLIILSAQPQWIDKQSKVNVEGIDIMMALDVSGSMQLFDDLDTKKERIDSAKEQAIQFVKKRNNDPIGLVFFGQEAVTRCPLTLDKKMLESIITTTELGVINPQGTMLSKGLLMAINRLKKSTAKSKIIIVLTDGEPTEGDENPKNVALLAKKYGIKIYTIGFGGEGGGYMQTPFGIQAVNMPFRTELLQYFAQETGGKMFLAHNEKELAHIYDTIDQLEKTSYETEMFQKYENIIMPYLAVIVGLFFGEMFLSRLVWFGL